MYYILSIDIHISNQKSKEITEDKDDLVMLFKMILESDAGLKVDSFTDPFSALDNFKPGLYDLIMIDIVLPKMNGFELYYKIRKMTIDGLGCICACRHCQLLLWSMSNNI